MTQIDGPGDLRIPFGVWAVAVLSIALWILLLLDAAGIRPSNSNTIIAQASGTSRLLDWIVGGIAVVGIAAAIALLRLRTIGYVVTIVLAGLGLLNAIASQLVGRGDDLRLALLVAAVCTSISPPSAPCSAVSTTPTGGVLRGAEGE